MTTIVLEEKRKRFGGRALKLGVTTVFLAAAVVVAVHNTSFADLMNSLSRFGTDTIAFIAAAIVTAFLVAAFRLKLIAGDLGYRLNFIQSVATVSVGQVGGFLFFQLIGQLVARGAYLARHNISMAGTVLITATERIGAAIVSAALAISGALYIFSGITLEVNLSPIRLMLGLLFVVSSAGYLWRNEIASAARDVTFAYVKKLLRALVVTIFIQLPMMAAYVVAAKAVAPWVPLVDLAAAATLVMFAASIPISFAGWGVRELSAVAALSAIGVPREGALLVALLIGSVSILAAFVMTAASTVGGFSIKQADKQSAVEPKLHDVMLVKIIPVVAMVLLFFQVNLPTRSTLINVNLADPILILGGLISLFAIFKGRFPRWRISGMNFHFVACTLSITVALFIGAYSIGWTEWAVTNKYLGWFVLMATALTGAMSENLGLNRVLETFVVAGCAVIVFQYGSNLLQILNLIADAPSIGFTQNSNAFAFQCLMVLCVALALPDRRTIFVATALTGIWLALSRAGLIAAISVVIVAAVYIRGTLSQILLAVAAASIATISIIVLSGYMSGGIYTGGGFQSVGKLFFSMKDSSVSEHLTNATGAVKMFTENPLFGGGLGVYINQWKGVNPLVIHSTPLWIIGEFGLVGLLVFLAPILRIAAVEFPKCRSNDVQGNFTVLIIVALAVMSLSHELLYQRSFWFLLGAALVSRPRLDIASAPLR